MKKTTGFLIALFVGMFALFAFYNTVCAQDLADLFGISKTEKPEKTSKTDKGKFPSTGEAKDAEFLINLTSKKEVLRCVITCTQGE